MNSTHLLLLSLACIAGGVFLSIAGQDVPANLLIVAGAGGLVKEVHASNRTAHRATESATRASKEADRANQRADEALEATQTLRRDLLKPPGA